MAGVYASVLFYFSFNEIISIAQGIGMIFMLGSVVLFGLEGAEAGSKTQILSSSLLKP